MSEIQWTGDNIVEIKAFMSPAEPIYMEGFSDKHRIVGVMTPDGLMVARIGDTISKTPAGEFRVRTPGVQALNKAVLDNLSFQELSPLIQAAAAEMTDRAVDEVEPPKSLGTHRRAAIEELKSEFSDSPGPTSWVEPMKPATEMRGIALDRAWPLRHNVWDWTTQYRHLLPGTAINQLSEIIGGPLSESLEDQDLRRTWLTKMMREVVQGVNGIAPPPEKNQDCQEAFAVLKASMQRDFDYAWSWHCNIAMAFYDASRGDGALVVEGEHLKVHAAASLKFCNAAAARFMKLCFDVDTSQEAADRHHAKESNV